MRKPIVENLFDTQLPFELRDSLERPFKEEKVKDALFGMDGSKALGLMV